MKNFVFILLICLSGIQAKSQNLIGKSFVTNVENVRVYPIDTPFNDGRHFYYVHRNTKFVVTGLDTNNNLIISFWHYKKSKQKIDRSLSDTGKIKPNTLSPQFKSYSFAERPLKNLHGPNPDSFDENGMDENGNDPGDQQYIGEWANGQLFILPLNSFNQQAQAYYGKTFDFGWGVMTLPVKLRFGDKKEKYFNFEEKLNLGFSAGIRQQLQSRVSQSINYLGGFGILSAKTDSVSLKPGFYDSKHLSEIAFSFNIGVLYQYDNFQVGIFAGKDYLGSTLSREWRYQGKTWVGLAIGISLFSKPDAGARPGTN